MPVGDPAPTGSAASEAEGWLEGYRPLGRPRLSEALLRVHWPRCAWRLVAAALGSSPWSQESFRFRGEAHRYFDHRYNATWLNERRVEIPLAARLLAAHRVDDVLEIGCVLRHYGFRDHQVVDRYERGPAVINVDICDFEPPRRYAAVLSISTLEHVGLDEPVRAPERCLAALEHVHRLVAPGGAALVTVPTGYNPSLDAALAAGRTFGFRWYGMVRLDRANRWAEVSPAEALARNYGRPFLWANGLLIGLL